MIRNSFLKFFLFLVVLLFLARLEKGSAAALPSILVVDPISEAQKRIVLNQNEYHGNGFDILILNNKIYMVGSLGNEDFTKSQAVIWIINLDDYQLLDTIILGEGSANAITKSSNELIISGNSNSNATVWIMNNSDVVVKEFKLSSKRSLIRDAIYLNSKICAVGSVNSLSYLWVCDIDGNITTSLNLSTGRAFSIVNDTQNYYIFGDDFSSALEWVVEMTSPTTYSKFILNSSGIASDSTIINGLWYATIGSESRGIISRGTNAIHENFEFDTGFTPCSITNDSNNLYFVNQNLMSYNSQLVVCDLNLNVLSKIILNSGFNSTNSLLYDSGKLYIPGNYNLDASDPIVEALNKYSPAKFQVGL